MKSQHLRQWATAWKRAGAELEKQKEKEIRSARTSDWLAFSGLLLTYLKQNPPPATSGLLEQQKYFQKLRPHA